MSRGKGLKIGDVGTVGVIAGTHIIASRRDLSGQVRTHPVEVARPGSVCGAENTPRPETVTIPIGAAERQIDGDALQRLPIAFAQVFVEKKQFLHWTIPVYRINVIPKRSIFHLPGGFLCVW
ncbi:hypothetical protein SDC9_173738 [bioreactor metagenome]|uniref:Uncharacterized protein n=1 Tax=bioreactor metagenome TaxID=1076179 RepID=A0A645GQS5_9ZZZZ